MGREILAEDPAGNRNRLPAGPAVVVRPGSAQSKARSKARSSVYLLNR